MTALTISSPSEVSMAIHQPRDGGYWYYWLIIVGGIVFVIAYYASDGFGLKP